jgi:hypothetical protein
MLAELVSHPSATSGEERLQRPDERRLGLRGFDNPVNMAF